MHRKAPLNVLAVAAACALALAAAGSATVSGPQQVALTIKAHAYAGQSLGNVHPGFVQFRIRNAASVPHGAGLVRLTPGTTPAQVLKILARGVIPDKLPFTLLGGVPQLAPGQSWQATMHLTAGRYLLFDDGDNGRGLERVFTVGGQPVASAAPPVVGTVVMRDFAFGLHLPANWDGKGVLRVPNVGKEIHELTFVRFDSPALGKKFAAILRKGYPQGPPPKGAHIVYAVGGMSPGQTSYVRVDLPAGHYVAICLFPDSKTGKPHTALGMLSSLTVR